MVVIYRDYDWKIPNIPKINKIWVNNICKVDYNLLLNFFWPRLSTKDAEVTNNLGKNLRGYRPNFSADNVVVFDEFITEEHRLTFRYLFQGFDSILNSHAILNSFRFEFQDKICKIYSNTLRNTEYCI